MEFTPEYLYSKECRLSNRKEGCYESSIAFVPKSTATWTIIYNFMWPGLGTFISAFMDVRFNMAALVVGIIQCCFTFGAFAFNRRMTFVGNDNVVWKGLLSTLIYILA